MPTGLVSGETSLLGLYVATSSLGQDRVFPLCVYNPDVFSYSYMDTNPMGLGLYTYDLI